MTTRRVLRCADLALLGIAFLAVLFPGVGVAQTVTLKFGDIYAFLTAYVPPLVTAIPRMLLR